MRAPSISVIPPAVDPAVPVPVEPAPAKKRGASKRKSSAPIKNCIPRLTFRRLMREIVADNKSDMRLQQDAVEALQEAAEALVTERFQKCSQLAELCHLDTVRSDHWNYVRDSETISAL
jgi:histone H3/H4